MTPITRLPIHLESPASYDPRDWYKHAISLCDKQYDISGVVVLGPIPERPFDGNVLVINVVLPPLFLKFLANKLRKEARLHLTPVACSQLWHYQRQLLRS